MGFVYLKTKKIFIL